ncbi:DUF2975 domain-containing protein [Paenibacillus terrigena]|uniref:DUF2975 domain-containing protein n=1 Tax=Paenibacillus terrigena TaxID=369333 RepID=UPI0003801F73|nr:DUF2975 domain-containing protein [Paenibacillus terrigena]
MKQQELSQWLKMIIVFSGCFGLLLCIYLGPELGKELLLPFERLKALYHPFIAFLWITGIPFFIALLLGWNICSDIRADQTFTDTNASRLKVISILAMVECVLYVSALLYLVIRSSFHVYMFTFILLMIFCAVIIAVFTSMLSHLVRKASEIQEDNELTI